MRRLMSIAAFGLFLAVPLWAQHGGHASSGGGRSFGGHSFGGHSSGFTSHGFGGGRAGTSHFSARSPRSSFRSGRASAFRGPIIRNSFRGRFRNRGFSNNCFGFRCRTGFFNPWWGYDPWLWDDWNSTDSRFDADYDNNLALANEMDEQSLIQQDIDQQRLLREEQQDGDLDSYAPRAGAPPTRTAEPPSAPMPATVLVFRDDHKQEVQNYAIVGQTLWNFTPGRTQKIPLSSLDLPATEKANDDRGVTFRVPNANEGQ
jgi:hypothetical protein